jgi:hypothetical protein
MIDYPSRAEISEIRAVLADFCKCSFVVVDFPAKNPAFRDGMVRSCGSRDVAFSLESLFFVSIPVSPK